MATSLRERSPFLSFSKLSKSEHYFQKRSCSVHIWSSWSALHIRWVNRNFTDGPDQARFAMRLCLSVVVDSVGKVCDGRHKSTKGCGNGTETES